MSTMADVKKIIADIADIDVDDITGESTLDSLGLDSLDMVELIGEIEDAFEVEFNDVEGIDTVEELVAYINDLEE